MKNIFNIKITLKYVLYTELYFRFIHAKLKNLSNSVSAPISGAYFIFNIPC
jgi:hypothetical protein